MSYFFDCTRIKDKKNLLVCPMNLLIILLQNICATYNVTCVKQEEQSAFHKKLLNEKI